MFGMNENMQAEAKYVRPFESLENGQEAYFVPVALGSLIIKERLGLSDRETTQQIMENPYLHFFIGNLNQNRDEDKYGNDPVDGQLTMLVVESLTVSEAAATTAKKARKPMMIPKVLTPKSRGEFQHNQLRDSGRFHSMA